MQLKVICLNVWWGGYLLPGVLDFLKSENADIVCLQEVYNGSNPETEARFRTMEVLKNELGYPYDDYAQSLMHDSSSGLTPQGNAVLSKLPITHREKLFLVPVLKDSYLDIPEEWPTFPRVLQHVTVDADGVPIDVFNMHGVWDLDGDNDSPARRKMVDDILQAIDSHDRVLLMGDMNAKPTNPAMQTLNQKLQSVFGNELATTFNMHRKDNPGYATAAVDMLFVSPGIQVLEKSCPTLDISDHLPLIVTLKI